MHASIPTTYTSLIFFILFFSLFFLLVLPPLLLFPSPHLLFTATTFYTICHGGICYFYPLTTFGFLWVSFQDYSLAYRLLSHYHRSECVGYTTSHSQTKLLILFLISLCFSLLIFG